jgi:hypothetical protein
MTNMLGFFSPCANEVAVTTINAKAARADVINLRFLLDLLMLNGSVATPEWRAAQL